MNAPINNPGIEKFSRYLSAYVLYIFFIVFGFVISWCLRSDILLLCFAASVPNWIIDILNNWGTFIIYIPFILVAGWLESYMNRAAKRGEVRKCALKVLAFEGGIGLVVFTVMGILSLFGYQPTF